MLSAEHVSKQYGAAGNAVYVVKDADLCLKQGELTVLVGESGSGKTTLSRILAGIIAPSEGRVLLDGKSITPPSRRRDRKLCAEIQMVLQDGKSALDPRFSVYRSIAEPIRNLLSVTKEEERRMVYSLMEEVQLSAELAERRPAELSGGQQKRVCIARALASSPRYLIFDEAVSGLDVLLKERILDLIRMIHRQSGAATLMITHDMDVALYMADRIAVMQQGVIVENQICSGSPDCLSHPYSRLLLQKMEPFS
ncbi:MAG: dipeptide/oligopeptide/nickel ABC transporter ATP-binding protein [Oscillospiraceae bacterium]|nr:dipeptide/oligopeptide/nickel ABC transporter ATP-binding protein [Oscillospiraceae bacterium]